MISLINLIFFSSGNEKLSQMSNLQIKNDKNKSNNNSGDQVWNITSSYGLF